MLYNVIQENKKFVLLNNEFAFLSWWIAFLFFYKNDIEQFKIR
jgi:hypothetical protein